MVTNGTNKKTLTAFVKFVTDLLFVCSADFLLLSLRLPIALHDSFGRVKNKLKYMVALGRSSNFITYHFKRTAYVVFSHKQDAIRIFNGANHFVRKFSSAKSHSVYACIA